MYVDKNYIKILVSFILLASITFPAHSQNIDQATSEVDRSMREEAEERMAPALPKPPVIEEEKEPIEEEGPKFFVKKIELTGTESFPTEDFAHIIAEYENKNVSVGDLKMLTRKIEEEYLKKGVVAACILPPQDVTVGVVTLQVIESKMGILDVQGQRFFNKKRLAPYWSTKEGEVMEYEKMSRSLQIMNKNPDREVRGTLHAGEKPGTTDVILEVDDQFAYHSAYTFDNEGAVFTGKNRQTIGMVSNNFLGLDDRLITGYSFGKDFEGVYGYHIVPVSNFGTSVFYGASYNKAIPKKDYEAYDIVAEATTLSFFAYQDLYQKDVFKGEAYFGIDLEDKTVSMNTGTYSRDKFSIFRVGANIVDKQASTITFINPELSQGTVGFLGSRRKTSLASRGAGSDFTKFKLAAQFKQALYANVQAVFKIKSQFATMKLAPQEEFALGGIDSVRGYPSADYYGDNAVQVNAELLIPTFFIPEKWKLPYTTQPLKDMVTGVLFADYGYGQRRGKIEGEKAEDRMAGAGLGLRINLFDQATIRLEWGWPLDAIGFDKPLTQAAKCRLHFSVSVEERLFQDFERIFKTRKKTT